MRKIKKIKKGNKLNKVKIEKESGIFIKEKKLKIVDESKIKIPTKALSEATLIPIFIKNIE